MLPANPSGHQQAPRQGAPVAQLAPSRIGHREFPPVPPCAADEPQVQCVPAALALRYRITREFEYRLPHLMHGRITRHRLPERYSHRITQALRPFPQKLPAFKTENTAPQTIE